MHVFRVKWLIIFRKICKLIKCFSVILQICMSNTIRLISSILQRATLTPTFLQVSCELAFFYSAYYYFFGD